MNGFYYTLFLSTDRLFPENYRDSIFSLFPKIANFTSVTNAFEGAFPSSTNAHKRVP